ncbi:MAG: transglutaminase TgpA family protein, partial [Wenzhouxiangella sp.]
VLFPRLAQPIWGLPDQVMDGRTGLSETMSPGSIAELFLDDSPAFRVEFEGQPPPPAQRYWRGPVLWRFDGATWRAAYFSDTVTREPVPVNQSSIRYRVQLEPHERRWLLALDYPVQSNMPESRVTEDYQLVSRHPVTTLSQYDVISTPDFTVSPTLGAAQRMIALNLPPDRNPRTRDHGAALRAQYPDDQDLIDAVLRWFREEEFFYSLSTTPLGRHGADEFLFDLRTGYCEYYASAFAILMRAAGIPTRIVTGYQGGFWNAAGQYLLVRQADAHAWNEVWLEGRGWVRVDPTAAVAPSRIQQGSRSVGASGRFMIDTDWIRNLRNRYDRVQHLWNRWVLGFDADRQRRLLNRLGLPDMGATGIGLLMISALVLIALPLAFMLLRERSSRAGSEAQRAWRRALTRLRRRGLVKSPAETPLEFAHRVGKDLIAGEPCLARLASMYTEVHYGPPDRQLADRFVNMADRFRPGLNPKRSMQSNS